MRAPGVTTPLRIRAAAASRRGDTHTENQDAWAMVRGEAGSGRGALYAVSDGVSSTRRGQWAARLTCARLAAFLRRDPEVSVDRMAHLVAEIDWELRENGRGDAACTLTVAWLREGTLSLLHVGDSSLYRVRAGRISRLSRVMGSGARLSGFLGMGPDVSDALQVHQESLVADDGLLLVTDGVTGVIRHTELAGWWLRTGRDPERTVKGVIKEVGRRKGADDATLVAVAVDGG